MGPSISIFQLHGMSIHALGEAIRQFCCVNDTLQSITTGTLFSVSFRVFEKCVWFYNQFNCVCVWSSFFLSRCVCCCCCCRHRHLIKNQIALNSCIRFNINETSTHTHSLIHSYENSSSTNKKMRRHARTRNVKSVSFTHNYILRSKTGLMNTFLDGYSDGLSLGRVGLDWFNCLCRCHCRCLGVWVFVCIGHCECFTFSLSFIWF